MATTLRSSLLVGILTVLTSKAVTGISAECGSYTRCRDCITLNPNCAWCDDVNVLLDYSNRSSSVVPAPLCGLESELVALGCQNIVNPQSNSTTTFPIDTLSTVSISTAHVTVRPGQLKELDFGISPPESSPVDMYLLMDLSLTMQQDLNMIRQLAGNLVQRMRELSSDFKIGFGSFIDKTVAPFADTTIPDFPCAADAELLNLPKDRCDRVYAYRHRLDLTANDTLFQEEVNNARLSASPDHPESLLDALLQVAVCEEEIGWRVKGQSRRIVVAISDGDYHYALDGKLGGIVSRPDAQCRISPTSGEYDESHLHDYPSSTFISDVLNSNRITPIFAVPSQVISVYNGLVSIIKSATVGILSADSTGIITLIEDQYRILTGTVVPLLSTTPEDISPDLLNITVLPVNNCSPGVLRTSTSDVCEGVTFPDTVMYRLQVSASPAACDVLGNQTISAQIQFIGFGIVDVNIRLICDCDCNNPEVNSATCNGAGTLECSTCVCNDNKIGGPQCTCPIGAGAELGCSDPLNPQSPECNGAGHCECGKCVCDTISEDSDLHYQGRYCQSNPINCPFARDDNGEFKPCAGHGICINSRCECDANFRGSACECTLDNSTCKNPSDSEGEPLCSGAGDCQCGVCICASYSLTFGQYCEECVPCRTSCSSVSPCVRCSILEGVACPDECSGRITIVNETSIIPDSDDAGVKLCSIREDTCEVHYRISRDVHGDEPTIFVAMEMNQASLSTLNSGTSNCNPAPLIWPIFVGITLAIIMIGVLAIVLWRCCTYLGEYLEYRQWVSSVRDKSARTGDNPLFVDPNAEYQNPRYRTSSTN